jgi:hypothetical protein
MEEIAENFRCTMRRVVMDNMCCGNCNLLATDDCKMRMADFIARALQAKIKKNIVRFISFDKKKLNIAITSVIKKVTTQKQRDFVMNKINIMKPVKIR